MVNLENVTAILIASSPKGRNRVGLSVGGRAAWAIGFRDMRDVLITQLKQRFPEETGEGQTSTGWRAAVDELILIARENGWVVVVGSGCQARRRRKLSAEMGCKTTRACPRQRQA